jgi:anti-sigma-K factor RskA
VTADIHTLTGAYVINALSEHERAAFERHMTECVACAEEVAELHETAARLGAAADAAPPSGLKRRVLAEVAQTRQLSPARDVQPPIVRARRWPTWVAGFAAAASIAVAVVLGVDAAQTNQRLTDELAQVRASNAELGELLAAPDARVASGQAATGGAGIVVVSRSQNKAIFLADGLPALPSDRTYQLWLIGPDGARSGGLLGPADGPVLARDVSDLQQVALTVEPAGGSPQGTTPPILQVTLAG